MNLMLEDGRRFVGDILIGADGLHSRVRQKLFGPATPKFTGILAWRGVAPMERLPPHLRRPVSTQWVGPNGHVTCYPVHGGKLLNMVGEVERDDWRLESWVEPGAHEECLADFPGWHRDLLDVIGSINQLFKWGLFLRRAAAPMVGRPRHARPAILATQCCRFSARALIWRLRMVTCWRVA